MKCDPPITAYTADGEHRAVLLSHDGRVDIFRGREWAGTGVLGPSGRIEDCAYPAPEEVYRELEDALRAEVTP